MQPPFFGAFHALAIDNGGGGAGFSFGLLAAGDVERMVNAIQHTIAVPPDEVVVDRAIRRKVLRKVAPLIPPPKPACKRRTDMRAVMNG